MNQLTHKLGSGELVIQEIPYPQIGKGMIIIKNHYSIISAGTEGSTVIAARKNLIGKAKERPQQVKQALDVLKKQGPIQTYRAISNKLDAYSPLGYSCSGEVIEVEENVSEFKVGDLVACAGAGYANHAEIVAVPINLCVKLSSDSNLLNASYNTLGAIALQGVRQADLRLGENCAVIGLGLLGQITALLLKSSGVNVVGIDVSETAVNTAIDNKAIDIGVKRDDVNIESKILEFTNGIGVDAVIIAAATTSLDPINFAGLIARKKGKVVILGAVPTGFDRDPHWYRKELELKMACSYGPGRYDINYEEKGIDYPVAYVRWTEKRNMEAFQNLLEKKIINIDYLTTHVYNFQDAPKAYDLVVNKSEAYIGIALKYDTTKVTLKDKINVVSSQIEGKINISFIGAGSYAQSNLLPNLLKKDDIVRVGILTNNGTTSKRVAEKFKFKFCASKEEDIFNEDTNTVFIATRHNSHASYVLKALSKNKNVFVEKPICLTSEELESIKKEYQQNNGTVMVGFNRRFSPLSQMVKSKIGTSAMTMIYRINAGSISKDSWIQDMEIGGGRIIGEACHFIDYLTFLNGSLPVKVSASSLKDPFNINDTVTILIQFENGSTGVVAYYTNGSNALSKEYIEVFSGGTTCIINDFKELKIYSKGKIFKKKLFNQNKGQKEMVELYLNNLLHNNSSLISMDEIYAVTKATFATIESINTDGKQFEI
jgi:predicted dehydrogenase/threonine dehydrogenase-like Zn-dependent dehydrogenase